jgi:hypothetical protein
MKKTLAALGLAFVLAAPMEALAADEQPDLNPSNMEQAVAAMMDGNYEEALRYYAMESETGNPQAQAGLAIMFASGHGMPVNYLQASKWLIIAEQSALENRPQMVDEIRAYRDTVNSKLTPQEIRRAEELAKQHLAQKSW